MRKVLVEALLVAITGAVLAFAANAFSSRGLKLNRDYFRGAAPIKAPTHQASSSVTTNNAVTSAADETVARLRSKGLQVIDGEQAVSLFQDPRYEQGLIIFVDARKDDLYKAGHIPGAYQYDHIYPERYLAALLPACNTAQQVVVYCDGGACELSEIAAEDLRGPVAVPNEKISVYAGGMHDWEKRKLPIETGDRKSGQLK